MKKQTDPDLVGSWTFEAIRTFAGAATGREIAAMQNHSSARPSSFGVTATTAAPHFGRRCPKGLPTRLTDQPGKRAKFLPRPMLR